MNLALLFAIPTLLFAIPALLFVKVPSMLMKTQNFDPHVLLSFYKKKAGS